MSRGAPLALALAVALAGGLGGCEMVLGLEPARLDPPDAGADAGAADGPEGDAASADAAADGAAPDGARPDGGMAAVPAMSTARSRPLAFLLQSGLVLVAFGFDPTDSPIASAETYDPETDSWSDPEPVAVGAGIDGTLLQDGRVLIPVEFTDYTTIYDPAQPAGYRWTAGPAMTTVRSSTDTVTLQSGKALVTGGAADASADLYDPDLTGGNGGFTKVPMRAQRQAPTATLLVDGRVLVVGGDPCGATTAQSELYDPISNTFSDGPSLTTPRTNHQAHRLADGRVLIVGGDGCDGLSSDSVEVFDPTGSETFAVARSMSDDRDSFGASRLGGADPRVIVTGGETHTYYTFAKVEIYDPTVGVGGTWTRLPDLPAPRSAHATVLLPDGSVLFIGGESYQAGGTTLYADGVRWYP